jgi:hypothetical protein
MLNLREQFNYVKRVVSSCTTEEQTNNAHEWAYDWSKRMKCNYPDKVHSHTDLFLDVISKL